MHWHNPHNKQTDSFFHTNRDHIPYLQRIATLNNAAQYSISCMADTLVRFFDVHDVCVYFAPPEYEPFCFTGSPLDNLLQDKAASLCHRPYRDKSMLIYPDLSDTRNAPEELQDLGIQAYAGVPIIHEGTHIIGALSVIDIKARDDFNSDFLSLLRNYSNMLSALIGSLQLQNDLSSYQARAIMALQGANLGLWDTNIRTGDTYFNDRWGTMLGYEPGELEAKFSTWEHLIHPDDYVRSMGALHDHLEGKTGFYEIEHRVRCKNGEWRWVLCRGQVFEWDDSGVAIRALGIQIDVQQRKIIEKRLIDAQHKAEEANIAKTNFLENISHEIRTPLNGIIATAGLLANTDLDDKQKKYAGLISDSGEILLSLLNDVLDLSKIEANKLETIRNEFPLRLLISRLVDLHYSQIINRPVEFEIHIDDDVPDTLIGDERYLKQVLNNLINNAVKFTREGFIKVRVHHDLENEGFYCFGIEDSGVGISEESLPVLFDKFTQGHADKIAGGTGLGLAICKSLVEYMDGHIGVESKLNEGSCFWFSIPLDVPATHAPAVGKKCEDHVIPQFKAHVLLVEDVEMNRMIIRDMLETTGLSVDEAVNGQEAVSMAQAHDYDLILMDLRLPVMDGFEASRLIFEAQSKGLKACPIVALTAHAMDEHRDACIELGMRDFLTKPLQADKLYDCLKRHL